MNKVKKASYKEPKIGDKIYVPDFTYVYRGKDDFSGGLATINKIEKSTHLAIGHYNSIFIGIEGRPSGRMNWNYVMENQAEWGKEYADKIACPDPDMRAEFNNDDEGWH